MALSSPPRGLACASRSSGAFDHLVEQAHAAAGRGDVALERVAWMLALGHAPEAYRPVVAAQLARLARDRDATSREDEAWLARLRPGRSAMISLSLASALFCAALYSLFYGVPLAAGLVAGMYVHELGHVIAMVRRGLPLSAPLFIPFVGARVRMARPPETPADLAAIALCGPAFGLLFGLACLCVYALTGAPVLGLLALVHAFINLANLLPFAPLDGGRALAVMSHGQRRACGLGALSLALLAWQPWVALLSLCVLVRAGLRDPRPGNVAVVAPDDWRGPTVYLATWAGLTGVLACL